MFRRSLVSEPSNNALRYLSVDWVDAHLGSLGFLSSMTLTPIACMPTHIVKKRSSI